jgi:tRNA(Arg) A34 adenosine deaminase TadA
LEALQNAERPVFVVGHGARFHMERIIALAERLGSPVLTTFKGKGLIHDTHPLAGGVLGRSGTPVASYFMNEADLLVVFGASFSNHTGITPKIETIQVDFDPLALSKFHKVEHALWGEIGVTAQQLSERLGSPSAKDRREELAERWAIWRKEKKRRLQETDPAGRGAPEVFDALTRLAPENGVFCVDVGNNAYSFGRYFEPGPGSSFLMSGYLGSIGWHQSADYRRGRRWRFRPVHGRLEHCRVVQHAHQDAGPGQQRVGQNFQRAACREIRRLENRFEQSGFCGLRPRLRFGGLARGRRRRSGRRHAGLAGPRWSGPVGCDPGYATVMSAPSQNPERDSASRDQTSPPEDSHMEAAIAEARQGRDEGGIPIGSVLVKDGNIVARGHNRRVQQGDPVAHAEIDCLRNAGRLGSFKDTVLYSTLMPCYLCAGAIVQFGIPKVVVGEARSFPGAAEFLLDHGVELVDLDLEEPAELMRDFMQREPALWAEDIGEEDSEGMGEDTGAEATVE